MTEKHECGLERTFCTKCQTELEVGQVGLCDGCRPDHKIDLPDNGNESMTHEDALEHVRALQALAATRATVGYALYDIEHGGSRQLIWADQYTPEGDPAKTLVVPLVAQI